MDFIFDNIFIIILAASGLVQWWKSTQEAKKERENQRYPEAYDPEELEEFLGQAERRHARPAVPPPLPTAGESQVMPGVERNRVPTLKRSQSIPEAKAFTRAPHYQQEHEEELARQAALAEQLSGLKKVKKKQEPVLGNSRKKTTKPFVGGSLRDRLSNRRELRQAIVLKEILDKPIGLR